MCSDVFAEIQFPDLTLKRNDRKNGILQIKEKAPNLQTGKMKILFELSNVHESSKWHIRDRSIHIERECSGACTYGH